jgi:hypothetical protein
MKRVPDPNAPLPAPENRPAADCDRESANRAMTAIADEKRARANSAAIDRVIRWCVVIFVLSTALLAGIAWYAVRTGHVGAYLNVAGALYTVLSTLFLTIIAIVFVKGHLGSSREIEAPKMELFEIEKRR